MEFHEKLQALRKQKGLTQEALAASIYVSRAAISKWESGRGYPGIDSLKALAKFFSVSVDELLSAEALLTLAEENTRQKESHFRDLVFGLLDCSTAMFFFLPFFGQRTGEVIRSVSLPALSEISLWLRIAYFAAVAGMIVWGILTLALQAYNQTFWMRYKHLLSLILHGVCALLFIISLQPYAAALLFIYLAIKVLLLLKKP